MLNSNELIGFGVGNVIDQTSTYNTYYQASYTEYAAYTASNISIGSAATNRVIVLVIAHSAHGTVTSVSIGGVTATILQTAGSIGWEQVCLAYATVPTGTTANISITLDSSGHMVVGVYSLRGLKSTTPVTNVRVAGSLNHTFTTQPGDIIIGGSCHWNNLATWTPNLRDFGDNGVYNGATGAQAQASSNSLQMTTNSGYESVAIQFR